MAKLNPKLMLVDIKPLIYYICWGYAGLNVLIAVSFWITPATGYLTITRYTDHWVWGALFMFLALTGFISLIIDRWWLIKRTLEGGLVLKFLWFWAILFNTIGNKGDLALLAMWSFLAYVQFITVIFFPDRK